MSVVVVARPDDEIADLIERVRASDDPEVGLVIPPLCQALLTPLNARLLSQFSRQSGRQTAIVTEDSRVQSLARANGFTVYGSVPAYERGIELGAPRPVVGPGAVEAAAGGAAAAVLEVPPPPAPPPLGYSSAFTATPVRTEPRRAIPAIPPPRATSRRDLRRGLYVAGAAVAIIGLVLFLTLSPSAKITITIAATPLSVNPTIQGGTDPTLAAQPDHVATAVINSTQQSQFQATPTGTATVPATAARATLTFSTDIPNGAGFELPQGNTIETADGAITFEVTTATFICIGADGGPPASGSCGGAPPNATAPAQDSTPEAKGNVGANTLTNWPSDPCKASPLSCQGQNGRQHDITVTNLSAATGGTDSKQVLAASPSDVTSWSSQVQQIETQLTGTVGTDLQNHAAGKSFAVDPTGGGKSVTFSVTPKLPGAGAQFSPTQITVMATAQATIYDPASVKNDIVADLNKLVAQGDELAPNKLSISPCSVTQANVDGTVILACSATDFSQPLINIHDIQTKLTGKNPNDAQHLIEQDVEHVQSVQVSESPLKLFYLPFFASRIEIDENFVARSTTST